MRPLNILAGSCLAMSVALAAVAQEQRSLPDQAASHRVLVLMRDSADTVRTFAQSAADPVQALAARTSFKLQRSRGISSSVHVMEVEAKSGETMETTLARLRADPSVLAAEPDVRRYPHTVPNDPRYAGQWYLKNAEPSAIDAETAWDTTTGSDGVVIAVLDTGIRFGHPDLRTPGSGSRPNRLLPGYDFISEPITANDGDGLDADPSDPGDWVLPSEVSINCSSRPSSWHGSKVAGIIGALSNSSDGISGATWKGWILPVRVLGKCGGFNSDILTAMRWAAGLSVPGVPDNPHPAQVLNMSFGSNGPCTEATQAVIDEITAKGVLMVVSAGNSGGPVASPANCAGVASVMGLRNAGTKVGFSSLGAEVTLGAPGGNCVNTGGGACLFSLDTTTNRGLTVPAASAYTDQLNANFGTSFSAPIVAAVAGLMLAVNGSLSPADLLVRLKEGVRPYPAGAAGVPQCEIPEVLQAFQTFECVCNTAACGAGMVHAPGAISAALRPLAAPVILSEQPSQAGDNVMLSAEQSIAACGRSVASYSWSIVEGGDNPPDISGANSQSATFEMPESGNVTVRLVVTDNMGLTDEYILPISSSGATATAIPPRPACLTDVSVTAADSIADVGPPEEVEEGGDGGGGGGGALDVLTLFTAFALLMYAGAYRPRRRSAVSSQVF